MIARALLAELTAVLEAEPELAARLRRVLGGAGTATDSELVPLRETGISVRTLRAAIAAGDLPAVMIGREYRVRRADLETWLGTRTAKPRQPKPVEQSAATKAIERARRRGDLQLVGGSRR